ncbi:inosine triphosphate pyrophosphatase-like protein [Amylocystis lapponica]|nr:inosine triphosphate pyrophosphatase-like protein [Amylocystis lapponica]
MPAGKLIFVTGNANKLKEVRAILAASQIEIDSRDLDIQGTTREVATAKCRAAAEVLGGPCITEDTALCFEALNGLPGPYIKHFMKELGHEGLNTLLTGFPTTAAWAYAQPILFEGRTDGRIVAARGEKVFGWDPIFEAENTGQTYAEMPSERKNKLSHRYRALEKLQVHLRTLNAQT